MTTLDDVSSLARVSDERRLPDLLVQADPAQLGDTIDGIYESAQVLSTFPEIGHRYFASTRNVRILLYGHYRIAYLIKADGNIDILGVFHGALDIERFNL